MWFRRMALEEWFDEHQYGVTYDVGESAVQYLSFGDLGLDLKGVPLRYGYHKGNPELRALIAEQHQGIPHDQVVVTNGASEALFIVAASLLKPGDHVVIEHPNYPSNYEVPRSLGCKVDLLELELASGFRPDPDELRSLITPSTKLVSLTHPNNPTGSMTTQDALEDLLQVAESCGCYLLLDETYRELAFDRRLPTAASLSPRAISISTMSKAYGLPGIRVGWIAAQDTSLIRTCLAVREQVTICNSAIGEAIAVSVLRQGSVLLKKVREHVLRNLELVTDWQQLHQELEWVKPEAGVVCFPRIREGVLPDPEELYQLLVRKYKTFVIPGRCFEVDNRFFRIGYGARFADVKSGLENIAAAVAELTQN